MADDAPPGLPVRRDRVGKLLLLGCMGEKGALALGPGTCRAPWHIAVRTDSFQHPGCIDFALSDQRPFTRWNGNPQFSATYTAGPGTGTFRVLLRWRSGHSPYPEIRSMEVWCFGVYLGALDYPKAPDGYADVAAVTVDGDGFVTVNGIYAGRWPDMLLEE